MKYVNSFRNLVVASVMGITGAASAQQLVHPLSFGTTAGGRAVKNWYKDYVGIRFQVTAPSSIAGDKTYTTPNDSTGATGAWAGAARSMFDTVKLWPSSNLNGCAVYTTASAGYFAGKIAAIWRGDCEFGFKAYQAQQAGAIAVVIMNNVPGGPVGMGAGAVGASVTIPMYMISQDDGNDIVNQINAGNTVTINIVTHWGTGKTHDMGFVPAGYNISANGAMPWKEINKNPGAYKNLDGGFVANYGRSTETNVTLKSMLSWTPNSSSTATPLHTDSVVKASFPAIDSIWAMNMHSYTLPTTLTGPGRFDLDYSISADSADQFAGDNVVRYSFYASDSLYCKARYDAIRKRPVTTIYTGPSTSTTDPFIWSAPYFVSDTGKTIDTSYFSVVKSGAAGNNVLPQGDQVTMYMFKWTDTIFRDSLIESSELHLVSTGVRVFNADGGNNDSSFQTFAVSMGDTNGAAGVAKLDGNSWYVLAASVPVGYALGCDGVVSGYPRTFGLNHVDGVKNDFYNPIWFGDRSTSTDASGNPTNMLGLPNTIMYPWAFDGVGALDIDSVVYDNQKGLIPSVAFTTTTHKMQVGVNNVTAAFGAIALYPNPATDMLNVEVTFDKTAQMVTYSVIDVTGKTISTETHRNVSNEVYNFNTAKLNAGNYYMLITVDGKTASRKFVVIK